MNIRERLKEYIKYEKMSISGFEKSCGFYNGFVNSIVKNIDKEKLDSILSIYPNLNKNWLLFGEGEMLLKQSYSVINITKNTGGNNAIGNNNKLNSCDAELIRQQAETISKQQDTINKLTEMLMNLTKK